MSTRRIGLFVISTVLLIAIGLTGVRSAAANSDSDPYVAGTTAAVAGDHAGAAAAFERAIASDGWSVGALVGLGNAYSAMGEHGRAILAFERAKLIDPREATIDAGLDRTREIAGVAEPRVPRVEQVVARLTADEWTWIAVAAGGLACLGIVALAWSSRKRTARSVAIGGVVLSLAAASGAVYVAPSEDRAIVLVSEPARIAPAPNADAAFTPAAGEAVDVVKRHGDFVLVRDEGQSGWLPRLAVERVVRVSPST